MEKIHCEYGDSCDEDNGDYDVDDNEKDEDNGDDNDDDDVVVVVVVYYDNTELSQIEHRRILGRRAINCDRPRHSSVVLLICDFARGIEERTV